MSIIINTASSGTNLLMDEVAVSTTAKVMVTGDTIFTSVGDVEILNLFSECITPNGATASTLQYSITPTVGSVTTISGASSTLANATAGTVVYLDGTALSTAPTVAPTGVTLGTVRGIHLPSGTLTTTIGVGSTTGTWRHYIRYRPLEQGAYVQPGF